LPSLKRHPQSSEVSGVHSTPHHRRRSPLGWSGPGRVFSFLVVAQLLSSAWFRATHHTYAVDEIVTGYGYPESAIARIVITECGWSCSTSSANLPSSPHSC